MGGRLIHEFDLYTSKYGNQISWPTISAIANQIAEIYRAVKVILGESLTLTFLFFHSLLLNFAI